jgi:hypothetical protein
MQTTEHKPRGGKRLGSGRKTRDTVQLTVRISRAADRHLRGYLCEAASPGRVIETLILNFAKVSGGSVVKKD